ncbi:hypothetical protein AGMMS49928_02710 [Spirochaetia bacterium]|nr:hypothetical protein AGMMS49928_02710 [Spirochaetia bacterium]
MKKPGLCVLMLVLALSALSAQQKYALVIGNANYQRIGKLTNTINDAEDLTKALRNLGYQVEMKSNVSRSDLINAIYAYTQRLAANSANEGFFWYAGHAVQIGDENYLLPVDVNVDNEMQIRSDSYSLNQLLAALEEARNRANVVILDACRDNPLPRSAGRSSGSRGLTVINDIPGDLFVMFSTAPGDKADDGLGKRNSPFAEAFLKNISSTDPLVLVATDIIQETMRLTNNRQRPFQRGSIISDRNYSLNRRQVAIVPAPIPAPSPAPTPKPAPSPAPTPKPAPSPAPAVQPATTPQTSGGANLMTEFRAANVMAAFNAIHEFLQTCNGKPNRADVIRSRIVTGDYLDLPSLTVQADAGGGGFSAVNTSLGEHGTLLRLIVVGVDSFTKTNSNAPAHVVFQFQNVPVSHRMNPTNTNAGGYAKSEMRSYLTSKFLPGLAAAGLPESIIWAPTRCISNGGEGGTAADALADKLWLPTEWELHGSNSWSNKKYETAQNQARLEFYESNAKRIKYNLENNGNYGMWYWEASPYSSSAANLAIIDFFGFANNLHASSVVGCAPAFCVR